MIDILLLIIAFLLVLILKLYFKIRKNEETMLKLAEGMRLCGLAGQEFHTALKAMNEDYAKFQKSVSDFTQVVVNFMNKVKQTKPVVNSASKKSGEKLN